MKKRILAAALCLALLSGCGARPPLDLPDAESDRAVIAYVPLDDRPDNVGRVVYLAESLGYTLNMPEEWTYKTLLDGQSEDYCAENGLEPMPQSFPHGSPSALYDWVLEQEAAGQRISALRGALWEEEGTQVLYLYLRVDTWKFWALGILKEEWMTVTDDRGNRYGLGLDAPRNPSGGLLSSLSGGAGKGPFHRGYTLRVWGVDPEAETIYLSYGPGDPVFTFTLDLEEGAA